MSAIKTLSRCSAIGLAVVAGLLVVAPGQAVAQSSSWTNLAGGSWTTATNWASSTIANGAGNTADLRGNTSGAKVINLDTSRTIGSLKFGSNNAANYFTLQTGTAGSVLTLDVTSGFPSIDVQSNRSAVITAVLAGTKGLEKTSAGTLFQGGANTYSGTTQVTAGTLEVVNATALGATGAGNHTVVLSGARVRIGADVTTYEDFSVTGLGNAGAINFGSSISGSNVSTATIAGQVTLTGTTRLDAATGSIGTFDRLGQGGHSIDLQTFTGTFSGGGTMIINSPIIGSGNVTMSASGIVVLAAANTYTGTTGLGATGTLRIGNGGTAGSLSTSSVISISSASAKLEINQSDTVTQGVDFSGAAINGDGSFIQAGNGTTILNAANAYLGTTSVNAGTLRINGDQSAATGAVSVAAGATLGGSGTIGGAVTVTGNLSPGNSPGVLTVPSLVLNSAATSLFEVNGTTRGTDYDGLTVTTAGGLTYGGALSLSFGNGSAFADNTTFDLFNFSTLPLGSPTGDFSSVTSTGFYAGTWTLTSGTWSLDTGAQKLSFSAATGDLVVVPEPSTLVLVGGIAVVGYFVRRRRAA